MGREGRAHKFLLIKDNIEVDKRKLKKTSIIGGEQRVLLIILIIK